MTRPLEDPASPHLSGLIPSSPGKPIEEVEREFGIAYSVKLASNWQACASGTGSGRRRWWHC